MLADYRLYWDPRSNKLFIPAFDTKPVTPGNETEFVIDRFRPTHEGCRCRPWFEAVYMGSFGTWGLVGVSYTSIIKCFTDLKRNIFGSKDMENKRKEFMMKFPQFKEVTFAAVEDCVKGNIPKTSVIAKEAKYGQTL